MNYPLDACLRAPTQAATITDVADWWPRWQAVCAHHPAPAARAMAGGFAADRVAWAFASGYQAALHALLPGLADDRLAAFCVTEAGGNRPRDIQTRITPLPGGGWRVDGAKRWATLGPSGTLLVLVGALAEPSAGNGAVDQDPPARPALRAALVPVPSDGLLVQAMPATRFVPEVPHATLQMADLRLPAEALLVGDAYDALVKPFRTLEDLHVTLAVLAYLLREARARAWPAAYREQLAGTLALLAALADGDVHGPAAHIALAGALHQAQRLYAETQPLWAAAPADDPAALRWQRDSALFGVAGAARQQRAQRAWERLATSVA